MCAEKCFLHQYFVAGKYFIGTFLLRRTSGAKILDLSCFSRNLRFSSHAWLVMESFFLPQSLRHKSMDGAIAQKSKAASIMTHDGPSLQRTLPSSEPFLCPKLQKYFSTFSALTRGKIAARPLQASQAANISLCGAILRADRVDVGPARRSHCFYYWSF